MSPIGTVRDHAGRRLARAAVLAAAGLALSACGEAGASSAQPVATAGSTSGPAVGLGAVSSGVASSGLASVDSSGGGSSGSAGASDPSATVAAAEATGTAGSASGDRAASAATSTLPGSGASTRAGTSASTGAGGEASPAAEASTAATAGDSGEATGAPAGTAPDDQLRVTATPQRVVAVAGQPLRVRVGWSDGSGILTGTTEDWGDAGTSSRRLARCDGAAAPASHDSYVLEHRFPRPGSYSFRYEVTTVSCHGPVAKTERAQVRVPITVLPRETGRR